MEPPPKPSQQPHSPYIKMMLLPGIGHNRDMSLSSYPAAESSAPQFQEEIHSSSLPLAIRSPVPGLGDPQSGIEGMIPPRRAAVGVSFLRAGKFFPEAKGSLKLV